MILCIFIADNKLAKDTIIMIGRHNEQQALRGILHSDKSEMVAVTGRRRVGKTYLIEQTYAKEIVFQLIGEKDGSLQSQLTNFAQKLTQYSKSSFPILPPSSWKEAFNQLITYLSSHRKKNKPQVVFLDELPWLATPKSGFLGSLGYFWNDWAVKNKITVILCGSAASWIIDKVINDKGGLHNRVTKIIQLAPFTLQETKAYLTSLKIRLDNYQIVQLYMALGGIPHYLQAIRSGESADQAIQRICFQKNGLLKNEFANLYNALFKNPERHISVIKALASKWKGMSRNEIIQASGMSDGGGLSQVLEELNLSSFIDEYVPLGKRTREKLYRLTDEYSLFYLRFMSKSSQGSNWQALSQSQKIKSWRGYAFENLCLKHIQQIKSALGISGLNTSQSGFAHKGNEAYDRIQIDLLIDRPDRTIHLCEMKYYNTEFVIDKAYARKIRTRQSSFAELSKTKKHIFNTLITTFGLKQNEHSIGLIDHVITIDDLM